MSTIKYAVCDRCGEKMEYKGKTTKIFERPVKKSKYKILSIFDGNPCGYNFSEQVVELCSVCTRELGIFLKQQD